MRVLFFVLVLSLVTSCASSKSFVKDPRDREEVISKIYVTGDSEFGDQVINSPKIKIDLGNSLFLDLLAVQLLKTSKGSYYLRVENYYQPEWKYLVSVATTDKEVLPLKDLSREVESCAGLGCTYRETGFVDLTSHKHLNTGNDLKLKLIVKRGESRIFVIPKEFIDAFLTNAG